MGSPPWLEQPTAPRPTGCPCPPHVLSPEEQVLLGTPGPSAPPEPAGPARSWSRSPPPKAEVWLPRVIVIWLQEHSPVGQHLEVKAVSLAPGADGHRDMGHAEPGVGSRVRAGRGLWCPPAPSSQPHIWLQDCSSRVWGAQVPPREDSLPNPCRRRSHPARPPTRASGGAQRFSWKRHAWSERLALARETRAASLRAELCLWASVSASVTWRSVTVLPACVAKKRAPGEMS